MAILIDLCNQALDEIAKGRIEDLDEGTLEAQACKRQAESILREMADWSDCFGFNRARAPLAVLANDRTAEWLYSYAPPSDLSVAIAVREVGEAATDLPGYGPYTMPWQDAVPLGFVHEGGRIYSNIENATLIYSRNVIEATELPPLGQRAFVLELAARLAMPLAKDPKIAERVRREAELARVRFIADEENKNPRRSTRYISEVEYARAGIGL